MTRPTCRPRSAGSGSKVTTELDADRVELTEALRQFTRQSAGADVSLVFYAGHGIEMDGVNYLVPVDARLERDVDVRFETVTVDDLLVSTSGASLRLLILQAPRTQRRHAAAGFAVLQTDPNRTREVAGSHHPRCTRDAGCRRILVPCLSMTRSKGVDYLRWAVRRRIEEEGLRPFSLRTGIPLGQLRSVVQGRAARSTTLESIAAVLDLEFYIGPPRVDCSTRPRLPPEIAKVLGLSWDASVADAVAAIDKDTMAARLRDGISMLRELLDRSTTSLKPE